MNFFESDTLSISKSEFYYENRYNSFRKDLYTKLSITTTIIIPERSLNNVLTLFYIGMILANFSQMNR